MELRGAAKNTDKRKILPAKTKILKKIIFLDSVNSTSRYLAENNCASGIVVASRVQTGGRGKHGTAWLSPEGGLWFSYIIKRKIKRPYDFIILSSVAVCETLEKYGLKPVIKWPNDILLDGKKAAGILIENDSYAGRIITGIGINVNNKPPKKLAAASISGVLGKRVDIRELLYTLLGKLDRYIAGTAGKKSGLIRKWLSRQAGLEGKKIRVRGKNYTAVKAVKNGLLAVDSLGREKLLKGEIFFL